MFLQVLHKIYENNQLREDQEKGGLQLANPVHAHSR